MKKSQTAIAAAAVASLLSVSLSSSAIAAPDTQVFERQESSLQFFQDAFQAADVVCGARQGGLRVSISKEAPHHHPPPPAFGTSDLYTPPAAVAEPDPGDDPRVERQVLVLQTTQETLETHCSS